MAQSRIRTLVCFSVLILCMMALTLVTFMITNSIWLAVAVASLVGFILAIATSGLPTGGGDHNDQEEALLTGQLDEGGEAGAYLHHIIEDACTTLDAVAGGDLSIMPHDGYAGDYQQLCDSLGKAVLSLNDCMTDINSAIDSAYTYSKCISEAAMQQSGNTSDQAVAIANLSRSMAMVADRSIHTDTLSRNITDAGENVRRLASSCSRQVEGLINAVYQINDVNKSLDRVARSMDDIAYRANLMAANASPEAAGQGYALVADDARYLAGISANAAQQAKQLIYDAINKTNEGYNISLQLRSTVDQVLSSVQSINESLDMIGKNSEVQAKEAKSVNKMLEEQAKAVHHGSASSDTSAEYSRGLEQAAERLGKMMQRFVLDEEHVRRVRESRKQLVAIRPTGQADGESIYKQLVWDDALKMGDPTIDTQHKQLIERVDKLLSSCFKGNAADEVNEAMQFVLEYTVRHFADEEKLQLKYGYPGYREHKQIHNAFKQRVVVMAQMLEKNGPTPEMIDTINKELVDWLLNHIKVEDKKISKYLRG